MKSLIPAGAVESRILIIRGQRVMLDADLAVLYGVTTKRLNEQMRRNRERFPGNFVFHLTWAEAASLRSQFATLETGQGRHRKYPPYAFTEHGAVMLATVLNSRASVRMSIYVVKAFVRLREVLGSPRKVARKLEQLEAQVEVHDEHIRRIIMAIRSLVAPARRKRRAIGFIGGGT